MKHSVSFSRLKILNTFLYTHDLNAFIYNFCNKSTKYHIRVYIVMVHLYL